MTTAAAALLTAVAAEARTRQVDDDRATCRAAPYATIQEAIDAAAPGDLIQICAGLYEEAVEIPRSKGSLKIAPRRRGSRREPVVIRGGIETSANLFRLSGLTIEGDLRLTPGTRVRAIFDNSIRGGGIIAEDASARTIANNEILDFAFAGIFMSSDSAFSRGLVSRIEQNRLVGTSGAMGIDLWQTDCTNRLSQVEVKHNTVSGNSAGGVGVRSTCVRVSVTQNSLFGNWTGIFLRGGGRSTVGHNDVLANEGDGIVVSDEAGDRIFANDFRSNGATDCLDSTTGTGTAGTANTWIGNLGQESTPAGICRPE